MSYHSLEVPETERLRVARTRELRDQENKQGSALSRPAISKRQVEFLEVFSACSWMPMDEIRQQVRVRKATLERWLDEDDEFKRAMTIHYNQMLRATRMSRKQVMKGILEAVDLARDQRQANTMITGWKEIGRMCGFYEPERREITLSVNGKQMIEDMKTMTREKLLELASEQDTIEAEFIRIDEDEDDGTT